MKRQFKAGAQAKREVRKLKLHLQDVNDHALGIINEYDNKVKELKKQVADLKESRDSWYDEYETRNAQIKICRNHNIELKTELMKVNKQLEHATEQKEFYKELNAMADDNEKKYLDTMIKQNQVMTDLQFAYDVMKKKRDGLISLLLASMIISTILYIW